MSKKSKIVKPPIWFLTIIIITALTARVWLPVAISALKNPGENSESWAMIILYPIFSLLCSYLAYRAYNERAYISWLMIFIVWLSLLAEIVLVFN